MTYHGLTPEGVALCNLNFDAAAFYIDQLRTSAAARDYLRSVRGIAGQAAQHFALGWAPPGWRALQQAFRDYDSNEQLVESGLVISRDGKRYDRFRERIMFPIAAQTRVIVGFGGRVVRDDQPKYLNTSDSPVFNKGDQLFGLPQATHGIAETGEICIVEGYMDVVSLWQANVRNACATLGTAMTEQNANTILRLAPRVTLAFDGDAAGYAAAERAVLRLLPALVDLDQVRVVTMPPGHDPDSFVRGANADAVTGWRAMCDTGLPVFPFLQSLAVQRAPGDYPEARITRGHRLVSLAMGMRSRALQVDWARRVAAANAISVDAVQDSLDQQLQDQGNGRKVAAWR